MSFLSECPVCHTVFRVDARTVSLKNGSVKCGVCGMVFNALEHHQPLLHPSPHSLPPDISSKHDEDDLSLFELDEMQIPAIQESSASREQFDDSPLSFTGEQLFASDNTTHDEAPYSDRPSAHIIEDSTAARINDAPANDPDQIDQPIDTPLHARLTSSSRTRARLIYTALALSFTLLAEIAWLARYTIFENSNISHQLATDICSHASCFLNNADRNLSYLKVTNTELTVSPANPHTLHARFAVRSDAPFQLPYPLVSLILLDAQGNVLVQKTLPPPMTIQQKPVRYLPTGTDIDSDYYLDTGLLDVENFRLQLSYR